MSTASEIVNAVVEKWKCKEFPGDEKAAFSTAMARGLAIAGIPCRGQEAVEIHALLLKHLLSVSPDCTVEDDSLLDSCISWKDYYQLLTDRQLSWHEIVYHTLPFMTPQVASCYLTNLVERAAVSVHCDDVTPGDAALCVLGLNLGLGILLDLILYQNTCENEHIGASDKSRLHAVVSDAVKCLEILLAVLESGLRTCLSCEDTFRAAVHSLLLTAIVACPLLPVASTQSHLGKYVMSNQRALCHDKPAEGERARRVKKSLKQQREGRESRWQCEEFPMVDLTLTKVKADETGSDQSSPNDKSVTSLGDNAESRPLKTTDAPEAIDRNNLFKTFCQEIIAEFKAKLAASGLYAKLVLGFCCKDYSDRELFYKSLQNVLSISDDVCIGRHQLSPLYISEKAFPLLWYLTRQGDQGGPAHYNFPEASEELLRQMDQMLVPGDNSNALPREAVQQIKQQGKMFPDHFFWLQLSEALKIRATGRQLDGDQDLEMLYTVVERKEQDWRELLTLGLQNSDFPGWWSNGFLKLFWAHEESMATEDNVFCVLKALCRAVQSKEKGLCDLAVVQDIRKLLSVMFRRLPIVLQECAVLRLLEGFHVNPTSQQDNKLTTKTHHPVAAECSLDTLAAPVRESLESFSSVDSTPGSLYSAKEEECCGETMPLSSYLSLLMTEEEVTRELTLILNRMTLANADQLTSSLLYLCLFSVSPVVRHLVQAAITSNGQTASVVKVLRNMPTLCRLSNPGTKQCMLITCMLEGIRALDVDLDDKQSQTIVQFLALLSEPYTLVFDTGASVTSGEERDGLLSVADIVHNFIFPSFYGPESQSGIDREVHILQSDKAVGKPNGDKTETKEKDHGEGDGKISRQASTRESLKMRFPVALALPSLELLLQKSVEKKVSNVQELTQFKPLCLMVVLCNCCCQNYTLPLVAEAQEEGEGQQLHLSRARKTLRQAAHRCLTILMALVKPNWNFFSAVEIAWLQQEVSKRGWLRTALLAPVLIGMDNWSNFYKTICADLCQSILTNARKSTGRLFRLIQLGLVNATMLTFVSDHLLLLRDGDLQNSGSLVVALKWILLTALPTEMERLVCEVRNLVSHSPVQGTEQSRQAGETRSVQPTFGDEDTAPAEAWPVIVCQKLVEAALLLDPGTETESLRCHALTNYQAALQNLMDSIMATESLTILPNIFHWHCTLLVTASGQAAQILQVTAMDILAKLKTAARDSSKRKRGGGGGGSVKLVASRLKDRVETLSDCVFCIDDDQVKQVLNNQLQEITV